MPEKREFPDRRRSRIHNRDSSQIIIAAEGTKTEKIYFETLVSTDWFHSSRVYVHVIENDETASSPRKIFKNLRAFEKEYEVRPGDQRWLVIDKDRWEESELAEVAMECIRNKYQLAVSNPSFELWLLLHVRDLKASTSREIQNLMDTSKHNTDRTNLERELSSLLGGYNKSKPPCAKFLPHINLAISRARALEKDPASRWPNEIGSRVYLLVEEILKFTKK